MMVRFLLRKSSQSTDSIVALSEIYAPYRRLMEDYTRAVEKNDPQAPSIYAQAQKIAQAFWAGAEYGRRRE